MPQNATMPKEKSFDLIVDLLRSATAAAKQIELGYILRAVLKIPSRLSDLGL